jgi:hypothetical protein
MHTGSEQDLHLVPRVFVVSLLDFFEEETEMASTKRRVVVGVSGLAAIAALGLIALPAFASTPERDPAAVSRQAADRGAVERSAPAERRIEPAQRGVERRTEAAPAEQRGVERRTEPAPAEQRGVVRGDVSAPAQR